MSREIGRKIRELRLRFGESQAEFGHRLSVEQATVSRWEKGEMPARRYEAPIAGLAGMSVTEFFHTDEGPRLIRVVGELATGGVTLKDEAAPGAPINHISLNLGENDQIALPVRGHQWEPVYRDGDTIIANCLRKSKIKQAIGKDCIVKTADGKAYIKIVRRGSKKGFYTLRDIRPRVDDMENVELEWAAPILWIGRAQ